MAPSVDLPPNKSTRNSTSGQRTFVRTLEHPESEIEQLIKHVPIEFQVFYHPEASERFASTLSPRSDKPDPNKYWDRLSPWSQSIVDQDRQSVLLEKSKRAKRKDSTKHWTLADTNTDDGEVDVDYTCHREDHVAFAPDEWEESSLFVVDAVSEEISDEEPEEGMVRVRPQPESLGPRQSWTACWMETPPGTWLAYSIDSETGRQNTTSEFDQLDFPAECYIRLTECTAASEAEYRIGTLAPPQDIISLTSRIRSRSEVGLLAIEEEDTSDDVVC